MAEHIVRVRHTLMHQVREVMPEVDADEAIPLADLPTLVSGPTRVRVGDRVFALDEEGLYQFWDHGPHEWPRPDGRPIRLGDGAGYAAVIVAQSNLFALLGAIASLQVHGFADNDLDNAALLEKARGDLLRISCGRTVALVCSLLARQGLPGWCRASR